MKVAVCDEELQVLDKLSRFLEQYCEEYHREIEYELFQSPIELFAKMEQGGCYDVLFLDILMKGENGIEVARELRKQDKNVKIIFLTSSAWQIPTSNIRQPSFLRRLIHFSVMLR